MPSTKEIAFTAIGSGVEVATDGNYGIIRFPLDKAKATPSSSGKMKLLASTGGWAAVPGTDLRFNVMAGFKA